MATVIPQNTNGNNPSFAQSLTSMPYSTETQSFSPHVTVSSSSSVTHHLSSPQGSGSRPTLLPSGKIYPQEIPSSSASITLNPSSISSSGEPEHIDVEKHTYEGSLEDGDLSLEHAEPVGMPQDPSPHLSPPEGGYGWVCVACVCMVNTCTWGLISAYGVYLAYFLTHNLHPTATPYHYAFIGGIPVALSMTVGPIVSFLYRRGWTTSQIMFLGITLQSSGLLAASWTVYSLVGLFLTQGILFGFGVGFLYTSSIGTISQWFSKRRSVANGIAAAGSGVGGLCFTMGINRAIEVLGVGWSFRLTAIIVAIVNLVAALLIRDRNAQIKPTQRSFDCGLLKRVPNFGLVLLWGFFSLLGYIAILFSMADYSHSVGLSAYQGSIASAMLNVGMLFGRPYVGFLSDSYGRINISALMTVLSAATVFGLWMPAGDTGFWLCIVFALFNGAVCGTFWATISPITAEIVGLKDLPSALSIVWFSTILPSTFGEVIVLALKRPEPNGADGGKGGFKGTTYMYPQVWSGLMYLMAVGAIWILRARMIGVKINQEVEQETEFQANGGRNKERSREGDYARDEFKKHELHEGRGEADNRRQMISISTVISRWRKLGRWWRWTKV